MEDNHGLPRHTNRTLILPPGTASAVDEPDVSWLCMDDTVVTLRPGEDPMKMQGSNGFESKDLN